VFILSELCVSLSAISLPGIMMRGVVAVILLVVLAGRRVEVFFKITSRDVNEVIELNLFVLDESDDGILD